MDPQTHGRWNRTAVLLAGSVVSVAAAGLTACGREPPVEEADGSAAVVQTSDSVELTEWEAFHDANGSLADAERRLVAAESEAASRSLQRAASAFDRLAERAEGEDRNRLETSATELRTLARDFPDDLMVHRVVLDEVQGRALVSLARHHLARVGGAATAGDIVGGGRHLMTAANDVAEGFRVASVEMPAPTRDGLAAVRRTAEAWIDGDIPSPDAITAARLDVRREAERLANALGARRR
jgi:hypothetical protein